MRRSRGTPLHSTNIFVVEQVGPEEYRLWRGTSRCPVYAVAISYIALKSAGVPFTEVDLWGSLSAVLYELGMPGTTFKVAGRARVRRAPASWSEADRMYHSWEESFGHEHIRSIQPVPPNSRVLVLEVRSEKLHAVTRWIHSTFSVPFSTLSVDAFAKRAARYLSSVDIPVTWEEVSRWVCEARKVATNPRTSSR